MFPILVEMFNITGLSNVYIICGHANFITRIKQLYYPEME